MDSAATRRGLGFLGTTQVFSGSVLAKLPEFHAKDTGIQMLTAVARKLLDKEHWATYISA